MSRRDGLAALACLMVAAAVLAIVVLAYAYGVPVPCAEEDTVPTVMPCVFEGNGIGPSWIAWTNGDMTYRTWLD
jgi:hypothetical protein